MATCAPEVGHWRRLQKASQTWQVHACQRVHPAGGQAQDRRKRTGRCQSKVLAGHTCGKLAKPQLEEEVRLRSWTRGSKSPSPFSSASP